MQRGIITISDNGTISVPDKVQMADFEVAELFDSMIPTVRANIRAILKSKVVIADLTDAAAWVGNNLLPDYYGLEMIMALAFRIHSKNAEVFRAWIQERVLKQSVNQQQHPIIILQWEHHRILN